MSAKVIFQSAIRLSTISSDGTALCDQRLRVQHRVELSPTLSALTAGFTMKGLMAALEAAGVPCGPANTVDQVFEEPQAIHRGLTV